MNTYYARHTMVIGIDQETRNRLWSQQLVAIHSPQDKDGNLPDGGDNSNLNPNDHSVIGKRRLNALLKLSKNGGYVYAEYSISETQVHRICGRVLPGSEIEHFYGTWGTKYREHLGRPAVLLAVRLVDVKMNVPQFPGVPARSTLCQWRIIGSRVADLF